MQNLQCKSNQGKARKGVGAQSTEVGDVWEDSVIYNDIGVKKKTTNSATVRETR